ncbi:MAG: hypothetical protein AAGA25_10920 [Planctomycetota bacterium]
MKDDDFRDWRRDEEVAREPDEAEGPDALPDPLVAAEAVEVGGGGESSVALSAGSESVLPGVQAQAAKCPNCGYNLTGVMIGTPCPQCGLIVGSGFRMNNLPSSGKAVAAMVLGIVSLIGCLFYGVPSVICGPLALVFAKQAKGQVQRGEVNSSSDSMATAGFICGLIGTILGGVGILAVVGFIVFAVVSSP